MSFKNLYNKLTPTIGLVGLLALIFIIIAFLSAFKLADKEDIPEPSPVYYVDFDTVHIVAKPLNKS